MNQKLNEQLSTLPVRIKTLGGFMGQSIQTNAGDVQQWYGTWFHQVNLNGPILGDPCTEFIQVKEVEKIEADNKDLKTALGSLVEIIDHAEWAQDDEWYKKRNDAVEIWNRLKQVKVANG